MKQIRFFAVTALCLFSLNTMAQTMDFNDFKFQYEYNDTDLTASVKVVGATKDWQMERGIIVIPDSVKKTQQVFVDGKFYMETKTYTVNTLKIGDAIGWHKQKDQWNEYSFTYFHVFIPKTIKCIESRVFSRDRGDVSGKFCLHFEDERTMRFARQYREILRILSSSTFPTRYLWLREFDEDLRDIAQSFSIAENYNNSKCWFAEIIYWGNPQGREEFYAMHWIGMWDKDFYYGNYYFTYPSLDEDGFWKNNNTSISNVVNSPVNYRVVDGVIYFDEVVNNLRLYDLQGKLLYSRQYGNELITKNNLKGVYILKYDNKTTKIIF